MARYTYWHDDINVIPYASNNKERKELNTILMYFIDIHFTFVI